MADPSENEKRRREEWVRKHDAHERDPAPLEGERPYDPDTGAVGTTRPRSVEAAGSAGPTGVVPPSTEEEFQWKRPAIIVGAILLIILLLLLLT